MKITCNRIDLLASLEKVIHAVPNRSTIPILQGIKITAQEGQLILFTTDLHIGILDTINADIEEVGEIVVPAKLFHEIIKKIAATSVTIKTNSDNIEITDGNTRFTVVGMNPVKFPEFEEIKVNKIFRLSQKDLKDAIRKTTFATAKEELRPILTGVYFEFWKDKTVVVGLDGYRMAMWGKVVQNPDESSMIVPAQHLNELYKILKESEEEVQIGVSNVLNYVLFTIGNTKIKSSLIEGKYIDYEAVFPRKYNTVIKINKEVFKNSLERAALINQEKNKVVELQVGNDYLVVSSISAHGKMVESLAVDIKGESLNTAFNVRYLLEFLNVVDVQELELNFIDPISPLVIKPVDADYVYMVLPVKLRWKGD